MTWTQEEIDDEISYYEDDEEGHLCQCPILHDDYAEGINICGACGKRIE